MARVTRSKASSAARITRRRALRLPRLSAGVLASSILLPLGLHAADGIAHTMRATDHARLRYISASGSLLYETGRATGTLPGTMRVHMRVESRFTGTFTIYTHGGSIVGHGSATPHGSGVYESFAGTLIVTGGTGAYRHARGRAGLYGTFDRRTYDLTIKTSGTLLY